MVTRSKSLKKKAIRIAEQLACVFKRCNCSRTKSCHHENMGTKFSEMEEHGHNRWKLLRSSYGTITINTIARLLKHPLAHKSNKNATFQLFLISYTILLVSKLALLIKFRRVSLSWLLYHRLNSGIASSHSQASSLIKFQHCLFALNSAIEFVFSKPYRR